MENRKYTSRKIVQLDYKADRHENFTPTYTSYSQNIYNNFSDRRTFFEHPEKKKEDARRIIEHNIRTSNGKIWNKPTDAATRSFVSPKGKLIRGRFNELMAI